MKDVKLGGGIQLIESDTKPEPYTPRASILSVRFKKLSEDAVVPAYAKPGDAGVDLTATSMNETDMYIEYGTDLAIEVPEGFVGLIYPRSSLSNYDLVLSNHVGVIDSGYRGEIKFRFKKTKTWGDFSDHSPVGPKYYEVGDRIGQLIVMPMPTMVFEEVEELSQSDRGLGGFGSSGK